jgi:UDP-3-O-[3-hydroxymyristoyl] N-acetylglucosamine deacetylase
VDTGRCTVLGIGADRISTVEHLLSACAGLCVSDLLVEVDAGELPIGDGSARCWVELLKEAGFAPAAKPVATRRCLSEPLLVTGKECAFVAAYPAENLTITAAIHFSHALIGTQVARFREQATDYAGEIAPARTFGFIEEVEALRAAGLARGGTLDNAIVIYPDHFSTPLRFDNELARHKLLDLIGDLALGGSAILPNADIIAVKPSHRLNTDMARLLLQDWDAIASRDVERTQALPEQPRAFPSSNED